MSDYDFHQDDLIMRTPQENAGLIRKTLLNERDMRKRVFADDPRKKAQKLNEIDDSLKALDRLEMAAAGGER